jgi:uncharacterized membrane protein
MTVFDKGFYTILGMARLLIVLAVPLALRKVPRNPVYGYRTRAAMASDGVWYGANAYFARTLIATSLCSIILGWIVDVLRPFSADAYLPVSVLIIAMPPFIAAIATRRYVGSFSA